ncbi:MAG TPA: ABC transporter ATP-binding protein [Actinomycetes bacterium]|nr:ABC transporter ATP-binding protein [Actinomycetes bacterium]
MTQGETTAPGTGGGSISIVGLRKEFEGGAIAVDGIDIDIAAGEFFSLLGPSGCGKTTTLRMLAGFEQPTNGKILIDGVDVAQTPPNKRPVNTVFQSYALFPHLDVWKNVEYGLRWRKDISKSDRAAKVGAALELVQLSELAKRRPNQMSGGQQQRVALARALVLEPSVLLLDEPLGALDAKLRHSLREQLTSLQREVGITFVFVTHDQEEALEMSDRLAVMSAGKVMQMGTPREIYQYPQSEFVADFLGVANLFDVEVLGSDGGTGAVKAGDFTFDAQIPVGKAKGVGRAVIRPECVQLEEGELTGDNRIPGMIERTVFLGSTSQVMVRLAQGSLIQALVTNAVNEEPWASGDAVRVRLPSDSLRVLESSETATWVDGADPAGALADAV